MKREEVPPTGQPTSTNGTNGHGGNGATPNGTVSRFDPRMWTNEPTTPPPSEAQPMTLDPKALLSAFRRRWLLAVSLGTIFGAIAAATAWYVVPAPYSTFAELRISSVRDKLLFDTFEKRAAFNTYKQTQMRRIKSPYVLHAAIRDPEIANLATIRNQEHPVAWLEQNIGVGSPATEFIRLSLDGEHPKDLAAIINAVAQAYLTEVVDVEEAKRRDRLTELQKLLSQKEAELQAELKLMRLEAKSAQAANPTQADEKQKFLLELHIQMRQELSRIHFELLKAKIRLAAHQHDPEEFAKSIEIPDEVADFHLAQEPAFAELAARIASKEDYLEALLKSLGDRKDHPRVVAQQKQLDDLHASRDQLREELRPKVVERLIAAEAAHAKATESQIQQEIDLLTAEKTQLEAELDKLKIEHAKVGELSFDLEEHDRTIGQLQSMIQTIASEVERLKIEVNYSSIGIFLERKAEVPFSRNTKKKVSMTGAAGMGMFGLFVLAVVGLEFQLRRISTMDEVAGNLSMRVMGALPIMPRSVTNGSGSRDKTRNAFWHSVLTESIDSARTMLLRDAKLESMNVVMIASAMGGEGKTTLSCHLSTSIARAGRNIVLVDCDMRRPSVHKVFDLPLSPGLCEVLRGEAKLEECIHSVSPEGLSVIPAGRINQQVLQSLARDGMGPVLDQLRTWFDFVLVDSSPVLPVTDSLLIAQHVDAVIFSIRRDVSRLAKVSAACQRLNMLGIPMLGAVVIGLDDGSYGFRYPYRYGYGYGYGAYRQAYHAQPQS